MTFQVDLREGAFEMDECGLGSCAVADFIIVCYYHSCNNRHHWKYKPESVQIYINALYFIREFLH